MGIIFFSWLPTSLAGDLLWTVIGAGAVFFVRDKLGKRIVTWWHTHASPRISEDIQAATGELHDQLSERLDAVHSLINNLQEQVGNGFLDELHEKLENMTGHLHERLDVVASEVLTARENHEQHLALQDAHLARQDAVMNELREINGR